MSIPTSIPIRVWGFMTGHSQAIFFRFFCVSHDLNSFLQEKYCKKQNRDIFGSSCIFHASGVTGGLRPIPRNVEARPPKRIGFFLRNMFESFVLITTQLKAQKESKIWPQQPNVCRPCSVLHSKTRARRARSKIPFSEINRIWTWKRFA